MYIIIVLKPDVSFKETGEVINRGSSVKTFACLNYNFVLQNLFLYFSRTYIDTLIINEV